MKRQSRKLTFSQISRYQQCPRRHFYEYVIGLRPAQDALALRQGRLQHEALAILEVWGLDAALNYLTNERSNWTGSERFIPYTVAATTRAYAQFAPAEPKISEVIETEAEFEVSLTNSLGSRSTIWKLAGKIDYIVRLADGRVAIRELKTVDDAPTERYFFRLLMDQQVSLYLHAAQRSWSNLNVETAIYDVIRKPSVAPLLATPLENRKYTKDGRLYANQRENDESPEEWEERLFADIASRPTFYFARREVPRLLSQLEAFADECWAWAKAIRRSELTGDWPRIVTRNCEWCPHLMHCCGIVDLESTPVPDGFVVVQNIHPELKGEQYATAQSGQNGRAGTAA